MEEFAVEVGRHDLVLLLSSTSEQVNKLHLVHHRVRISGYWVTVATDYWIPLILTL